LLHLGESLPLASPARKRMYWYS